MPEFEHKVFIIIPDAGKRFPFKHNLGCLFDLFHEGHYRLLKRAKALGDYLIVGVTTEHYDELRGKMNVVDSLMDRINAFDGGKPHIPHLFPDIIPPGHPYIC